MLDSPWNSEQTSVFIIGRTEFQELIKAELPKYSRPPNAAAARSSGSDLVYPNSNIWGSPVPGGLHLGPPIFRADRVDLDFLAPRTRHFYTHVCQMSSWQALNFHRMTHFSHGEADWHCRNFICSRPIPQDDRVSSYQDITLIEDAAPH